jgi:hypothetical protein
VELAFSLIYTRVGVRDVDSSKTENSGGTKITLKVDLGE